MEDRVFPYRFLPEPVRAFFLDSGIEDVALIVTTNGLSAAAEDALDTIQQEILFGYEPVDKVVNLLKTRLGYDGPLATKVALDLIQRRFLPIDAYLQAQAFRTFQQLGGNVTVVNIPTVERTALTVSQVRRNVDEFFAEEAARQKEEADAAREQRRTAEVAERTERQAFVATVKKLDERMDADADLILPEQRLPTEALAKGGRRDTGGPSTSSGSTIPLEPVEGAHAKPVLPELVEGPELDPSHELAPPPPMVQQENEETRDEKRESPKRQRRRLKAVVDPQASDRSVPRQAREELQAKPILPEPVEGPQARRGAILPYDRGGAERSEAEGYMHAPKQEYLPKPVEGMTNEERKALTDDLNAEAEVAKIVDDLKASGDRAPRSIEHPKIDEIQRKLSLSFASADLSKRFRVLLGSRLSGVRSADEFQKALARPIAKGGLAFDAHTVDRVMEAVEGHRTEHQTASEKKVAAEKSAYVQVRQERHAVPKPEATHAEVPTPPETPTPSRPTNLGERKTVRDVSPARRLVGPLEELRRMRIDDVRRIPGSVDDAKTSLLDDFDQIAKHDPGQRIRAVDAWRTSPLVAAYQRILSASLQQGVPVKQVLSDRAVNPSDITLEEFNLVRQLNAALRY